MTARGTPVNADADFGYAVRMFARNRGWPAYAIIAVGVGLRLALAAATPADRAYDDHFEPVEIILTKGEIPSAADCWECFQPPLYYIVSAGVYSVSGLVTQLTGASAETVEAVGRKAIQFGSVAAGAVTLYVCLLVLRRVRQLSPVREALVIAFVAFLPRHIYMSAMATNDALTYLLAALAIHAALRGQQRHWPLRDCLLSGALAGAAVLCKGYGLMVALAIVLCIAWFDFLRAHGQRATTTEPPTTAPPARAEEAHGASNAEAGPRHRVAECTWLGGYRTSALVSAAALAVGIWPTVRNLAIYDRIHVDNYDLHDTPMHTQPPGSRAETSFSSFRFVELLRRPWVHVAHADSLWTELYARLWFDYEGFGTSLATYPPWQVHWDALRDRWERDRPGQEQWPVQRWQALLDYADDQVPPNLRRAAVVAYVAGLPLTVCVLAGLVVALRRFGRDFALTLLALNLLLAVLVPVFQTLRLPHFAAMKAAFMLGGLSTIPVFAAHILTVMRAPIARVSVWLLGLALGAIVIVDVVFILR